LVELYHQLKADIDERDKKIIILEADRKRIEQDKAAMVKFNIVWSESIVACMHC